MNILIRPESAADQEAIRHVNRVAFGQDAEAQLVDALRDGGYVRLSLLAEESGRVVGNILFSDLPIITEVGTVPALAPAPMAVLPELQRQGIGSVLVRSGMEGADSRGTRSPSSWGIRTSTLDSAIHRSCLPAWSLRFPATTPSWRSS